MKRILNTMVIVLLSLVVIPLLVSCSDDFPESHVTQMDYPSAVNLDVLGEYAAYVYSDATQTTVLPLIVGQSVELGYSLEFLYSDIERYTDVAWESSNTTAVSIDEYDNGNCKITGLIGAQDESQYSLVSVHPKVYYTASVGLIATLKVIVYDSVIPVSQIEITYEPRDEYFTGESVELGYEFLPGDATYRTVKWTTSNSTVATVDDKGLVTFLSSGDVTITCTSIDGYASDSVTFAVKKGEAPSSISANNPSQFLHLSYGQKLNLRDAITMTPADATFSMIEWSDSEDMISVDSNSGQMTVYFNGNLLLNTPMIDRELTLTATSTTTGEVIGEIAVTIDAGAWVHDFAYGVDPLSVPTNNSNTPIYYEQDGCVRFVLNTGGGRQDLNMSVNGSGTQGGWMVATNTYKYFAMKMRPPYTDCTDGVYTAESGKIALNLTPYCDADGNTANLTNPGHQTLFSYYDTTTWEAKGSVSNTTYEFTGPLVMIFNLTDVSALVEYADAVTGLTNMRNFELIMADFLKTQTEGESYDLYWMGCFDSIEAVKEYYEAHE